MRLLSWNCCGLGRSSAVRGLRSLVRRSSPTCIFIMETKIDSRRTHNVSRSFGFDNFLAVDRGVECEGLDILWQSEVSWDVFHRSGRFIGTNVTEEDGFMWSLWLCHSPAKRVLRRVLWNDLGEAITLGRGNWACVGDFNDVACQEEKMGGRSFTCKSKFFLCNFMYELGAVDLGFNRKSFTWCNKRIGEANIWERLDRVIASLEWRIRFDRAGVLHLNSGRSFPHFTLLCAGSPFEAETFQIS